MESQDGFVGTSEFMASWSGVQLGPGAWDWHLSGDRLVGLSPKPWGLP